MRQSLSFNLATLGWLLTIFSVMGIAVFVLTVLGGCEAHLVKAKDFLDIGGSFLDRKGIAEAEIDGVGKFKGYTSDPNVEAVRAIADGVAKGAVQGAK